MLEVKLEVEAEAVDTSRISREVTVVTASSNHPTVSSSLNHSTSNNLNKLDINHMDSSSSKPSSSLCTVVTSSRYNSSQRLKLHLSRNMEDTSSRYNNTHLHSVMVDTSHRLPPFQIGKLRKLLMDRPTTTMRRLMRRPGTNHLVCLDSNPLHH